LQCVAVCCSVLQCVSACCSVLQCVAAPQGPMSQTDRCRASRYHSQCVAQCCNVLQCVAVYCNVLQCATVCCSTLRANVSNLSL